MHRLLSVAIALATALPAVAGERLAGRAHVLDGDTIVVDGIHVRLKGVAAPEVEHYDEPGEGLGDVAPIPIAPAHPAPGS